MQRHLGTTAAVMAVSLVGCHWQSPLMRTHGDPVEHSLPFVQSGAASTGSTRQLTEETMNVISVSRVVDAPQERVWAMLADYGNVHRYTSVVRASHHESGPEVGVGAVRQCSVSMGMKLHEEVVDWNEGESLTVKIESRMPTKNHFTTLRLEPVGDQTRLTMNTRYQTSGWALGRAMDAVMMRRFMKQSMNKFLTDFGQSATEPSVSPGAMVASAAH